MNENAAEVEAGRLQVINLSFPVPLAVFPYSASHLPTLAQAIACSLWRRQNGDARYTCRRADNLAENFQMFQHPRLNALSLMLPCVLGLVGLFGATTRSHAEIFTSHWQETVDRVWIGPEYWANPMEDWRIEQGRMECVTPLPGRNVQLLTHQLSGEGAFTLSVRCGLVAGKNGSVGFELGIHDEIVDYRGNCFFGSGVPALLTTAGQLKLAGKVAKLTALPALDDVRLILEAQPEASGYQLALTVADDEGTELGTVRAKVPAERLIGNIALTHNPRGGGKKPDALFWFSDWKVTGDKLNSSSDRTFGPILWAMHTLSNSRGDEGYVMKMTALLPPIGAKDSQTVRLETKTGNTWKAIGEETIDADARTATFRIPNWTADRDVPYRLGYSMIALDGSAKDYYWTGTVRKDVDKAELVLAGLTCQYHYGFPYTPLVNNLQKLDPDMLFFSGDQIYEANGNFGIVRTPDERAIVNYLRKYYMFGWAFGDLMRDRPTICIPDDHDVFHGNLWGEGGAAPSGDNSSTSGGYLQSPRFVNAVYCSHTSHHPDFFDPTPCKRDIRVFYGDMVYGRISFAIVSDREFKSRPGLVDTGSGRADHLADPDIDPATLDKPGLKMLGDRQMKFLEHWVEDWRGADMKTFLSQTIFANAATHHGTADNFLIADLDSGGWPQSARNRAVRLLRKAFPLQVAGDQHLTTMIHLGVDEQRDGFWSFCTPAISVGYQRWWRADEMGRPVVNRPSHGLPNTGEYLDGFGNKMYVYSLGNPEGSRDPNRYTQAHIKASGFGIVRINRDNRTYTCESYRFDVDAADGKDAQFPGWPVTIGQTENYARKTVGRLGPYKIEGVDQPVLKIYDEADGELVYALRLPTNTARPGIFADGSYTVKVGDPDCDEWKVFKGQKPVLD